MEQQPRQTRGGREGIMKYFCASFSMFLALSLFVFALVEEAKTTQLLALAAIASILHGFYLQQDDDDYEIK